MYNIARSYFKWKGFKKRWRMWRSEPGKATSRPIALLDRARPCMLEPCPWTWRVLGAVSAPAPGEPLGRTLPASFPGSLVLCHGRQHVSCLLSSHHWDASIWPQVEENLGLCKEKWKNDQMNSLYDTEIFRGSRLPFKLAVLHSGCMQWLSED